VKLWRQRHTIAGRLPFTVVAACDRCHLQADAAAVLLQSRLGALGSIARWIW
jgi:hypothetical protein